MQRLALYVIVNRELVFVEWVNVPKGKQWDSWLKEQGYSSNYTLRAGIVRDVTPAEARALHREHDRLKAEGKLPSVLGRVVAKLAKV